MVRDKKTIKFNPLDKISASPVVDIDVKTRAKSPSAVKPSPKKGVTRSDPKSISKAVINPESVSVRAPKSHQPDKPSPSNESGQVSVEPQYQALDVQVGYSAGPSLDWQDAQLQYSPQTRNFGFFDQNGAFVGFSAENLKSQIHAGSILPKALIGLLFGGGVGFALSYLLAKNPERYVYFQLQKEAGSILYLRLNSRALGYII